MPSSCTTSCRLSFKALNEKTPNEISTRLALAWRATFAAPPASRETNRAPCPVKYFRANSAASLRRNRLLPREALALRLQCLGESQILEQPRDAADTTARECLRSTARGLRGFPAAFLAGEILSAPRSPRPASIASTASRCVTSSCSSRPSRARSASCARINRRLKSCIVISVCLRPVISIATPNIRKSFPFASCRIRHGTQSSAACRPANNPVFPQIISFAVGRAFNFLLHRLAVFRMNSLKEFFKTDVLTGCESEQPPPGFRAPKPGCW